VPLLLLSLPARPPVQQVALVDVEGDRDAAAPLALKVGLQALHGERRSHPCWRPTRQLGRASGQHTQQELTAPPPHHYPTSTTLMPSTGAGSVRRKLPGSR
jgi:hypothetical protein